MVDRMVQYAVDTPWLGRARDERSIALWARSVDVDPLIVTGPSGMGKTTTIVRALRSVQRHVAAIRIGWTKSRWPYAHGVSSAENLDLSCHSAAGQQSEGGPSALLPGLDISTLLQQLTERVHDTRSPDVARVLFIDDVKRLDDDESFAALYELEDTIRPRNWRVVVGARVGPAKAPDGLLVRHLDPLDVDELYVVLQDALPVTIAGDVMERLHWWSAGNPQIALELAENLTRDELMGAVPWVGPGQAGAAAKRVYGDVVAALDEATCETLAGALANPLLAASPGMVVPAEAPGLCALVDAELVAGSHTVWTVTHPMTTVLAGERLRRNGNTMATAQPGPPSPDLPTVLTDLNAYLAEPITPPPGIAPQLRAATFALALMSGQTAGLDLSGIQPHTATERFDDNSDPGDGSTPSWWDHVWWLEPEQIDPHLRAAGRRVAAAILRAERGHAMECRVTLATDLTSISAAPFPAPHAAFLLVRGFLVAEDLAGAHSVLTRFPTSRSTDTRMAISWIGDQARTGARRPPTIADRISVELASAMVAAVEGYYRRVRDHIDRIERLRQVCARWPAVCGLRVLSNAALDGATPPVSLPDETFGGSPRALGEHALDLAIGHFLLGYLETAASLFSIGLEHCPWPYQGRLEMCTAAFESLLSATSLGARDDRVYHRVRAMLTTATDDVRTADSHFAPEALAKALLAVAPVEDSLHDADPVAEYEAALLSAVTHGSIKHRIMAGMSYGRFLKRRGEQASADSLLDEAATMARFASMEGWALGITSCRSDQQGTVREPAWDRLDHTARTLVQMAIHGSTNAEIAKAVFVSERTVVNRLRHIYAELGVDGRRELIELVAKFRPPWLTSDKNP
ncbi:LuxR family transcriptional regulator [Phytoactinopolyspora limicola]|uniref:LuxR family transcriptional regulator n=1 Tax=Phytoactinopolyspora limicola TaxID=2715536 RepID=UPI00140B1164|nr:LuxR family transcriptional regulator [Phytoactinopolyspora limicola]